MNSKSFLVVLGEEFKLREEYGDLWMAYASALMFAVPYFVIGVLVWRSMANRVTKQQFDQSLVKVAIWSTVAILGGLLPSPFTGDEDFLLLLYEPYKYFCASCVIPLYRVLAAKTIPIPPPASH